MTLEAGALALLEAVARGETTPAAALERLGAQPFRDLGFARVDTHRELRQGAPEAVLAEGKAPHEVAAIVAALLDAGAASVLVTRADARPATRCAPSRPDAEEDARARLAWIARQVPAARGRRDRVGRHVRRAGGHGGARPRGAARARASSSTPTPAWPASTGSLPRWTTCAGRTA